MLLLLLLSLLSLVVVVLVDEVVVSLLYKWVSRSPFHSITLVPCQNKYVWFAVSAYPQ